MNFLWKLLIGLQICIGYMHWSVRHVPYSPFYSCYEAVIFPKKLKYTNINKLKKVENRAVLCDLAED